MLSILSITGPIYLAVLIGYACTRLGLFAKADMRLFGKFVINLALPALLPPVMLVCRPMCIRQRFDG